MKNTSKAYKTGQRLGDMTALKTHEDRRASIDTRRGWIARVAGAAGTAVYFGSVVGDKVTDLDGSILTNPALLGGSLLSSALGKWALIVGKQHKEQSERYEAAIHQEIETIREDSGDVTADLLNGLVSQNSVVGKATNSILQIDAYTPAPIPVRDGQVTTPTVLSDESNIRQLQSY